MNAIDFLNRICTTVDRAIDAHVYCTLIPNIQGIILLAMLLSAILVVIYQIGAYYRREQDHETKKQELMEAGNEAYRARQHEREMALPALEKAKVEAGQKQESGPK